MEQKIEKIKQEYIRQYQRYIGYNGYRKTIISIRQTKVETYEAVLRTLGISPDELLRKEKLID